MLKVGLIGAGMMGSVHANAYSSIKHAKLVGIADPRSEAVEPLAAKSGVPAYKSMEDLVRCENPDIIDICLPTYMHKEFVIKAASLGKHVLCEKPIATSISDANAMIEACNRAGVKFMVAQVLRFFPDYIKAKQAIDRGAVGKPATIRAFRGGAKPAWSDWFMNYSYSGGVILDLIIHDIDWMLWTFGDVERVYAKSLMGREALSLDHAFVSLRFKSGAIGHVSGSWAYPDGFRTSLEVTGDKGMIHMDSNDMPTIRTISTNKALSPVEGPLGVDPYADEIHHFIDCIIHNRQPAVTGEDATKSIEVSLAAIQSVKTGEAVTLGSGGR